MLQQKLTAEIQAKKEEHLTVYKKNSLDEHHEDNEEDHDDNKSAHVEIREAYRNKARDLKSLVREI